MKPSIDHRTRATILEYVTSPGCGDCRAFGALLTRVAPDYPTWSLVRCRGFGSRYRAVHRSRHPAFPDHRPRRPSPGDRVHLSVSRAYGVLGYGMMNGTHPGHTFILVRPDGRIGWRADCGGAPAFTMYVPDQTLLSELRRVLGTSGAAS